jgi:two-component system response regulator FlrC
MAETKKKILIVEDDLALSGVLSNKLGIAGYDAAMAPDGQVAMNRIEEDRFDLILLDLSMPWYDGFQVLEELKKKESTIPVVVMSNLAGMDSINKAKSLGAVDYLVKTSVTPDLIVQEIQKYL